MIITEVSLIAGADTARYCWASLRRFQNVAFVEETLVDLHSLPRKHRKNVVKQAQQIRYCLHQAKEYHDAASAVGLATKPLLLYYSIMSLALAEILLKQSGDSSLDKARGEHKHHGLSCQLALLSLTCRFDNLRHIFLRNDSSKLVWALVPSNSGTARLVMCQL